MKNLKQFIIIYIIVSIVFIFGLLIYWQISTIKAIQPIYRNCMTIKINKEYCANNYGMIDDTWEGSPLWWFGVKAKYFVE